MKLDSLLIITMFIGFRLLGPTAREMPYYYSVSWFLITTVFSSYLSQSFSREGHTPVSTWQTAVKHPACIRISKYGYMYSYM